MEHRIIQLNLLNKVNLKGHLEQDELRKMYKKYHLAIQPSMSEALSNGLLDLVFHNLPCVISNVGGMPEIVKDGVNGLIFDVSKPEQLDSAILNCLKIDQNKLWIYNETLIDKFSLKKEIKELEKMYVDVFN